MVPDSADSCCNTIGVTAFALAGRKLLSLGFTGSLASSTAQGARKKSSVARPGFFVVPIFRPQSMLFEKCQRRTWRSAEAPYGVTVVAVPVLAALVLSVVSVAVTVSVPEALNVTVNVPVP